MAEKKIFKSRPLAGAFISLLLALTFVSLAFAPVTQPAQAATDWETVAVGTAIGAGSGAVVGGLIADGPGAAAGAVVGALWGGIAGWMAQDRTDAAHIGAKQEYATQMANILTNYLGIAHANAVNMIDNYNAQQLFFARKAEWAALQLYNEQTANGLAHNYDPYYVMAKSEVANGTLAASMNIAQVYEGILNSNKDLTGSFVGNYEGMTWGYNEQSNNLMVITAPAAPAQTITKVLFQLTGIGSTNTQYVTLSAGSPFYLVTSSDSAASGTLTVTNRNGTVVHSESYSLAGNGYAKAVWVPVSGEYNIKASSGTVMGLALAGPAMSSSHSLTPVIVAATSSGDNIKFSGRYITGTYAGYYWKCDIFWIGGSGITTKSVSLAQIKTDMSAITSKITTMIGTANTFAQAYYNTLVSEGGGANRIMPDIVFPDPMALDNMTTEQVYAIFLAYLQQQQAWFANYSVQDPSSVNISQESLNLKVRGSIYLANGTMLYGNTTIFTPYISLANAHLTLGRNNMTQPGFAILWGTAATIDGLEHLTDLKYLPLAAGDYFIIEEMQLANEDVTETDLTVQTIQYIVYSQFLPTPPPGGDDNDTTDLDFLLNHWYWFAVIAGVIMLLAWIPTRNPTIGIIGLILLAVGAGFWLYADWQDSGGLLSGLFDGWFDLRGRL